MARSKPAKTGKGKIANNYRHPESESLMRSDVGTQAQFKKKLPHAPIAFASFEGGWTTRYED